MAAQNDNHRYSKRNLVRTESFDKNLNRGVNRRHIVSSTLTFRDRIPNDVRCTGKPSLAPSNLFYEFKFYCSIPVKIMQRSHGTLRL